MVSIVKRIASIPRSIADALDPDGSANSALVSLQAARNQLVTAKGEYAELRGRLDKRNSDNIALGREYDELKKKYDELETKWLSTAKPKRCKCNRFLGAKGCKKCHTYESCPECKSTKLKLDTVRGELVCENCGLLVDEHMPGAEAGAGLAKLFG